MRNMAVSQLICNYKSGDTADNQDKGMTNNI